MASSKQRFKEAIAFLHTLELAQVSYISCWNSNRLERSQGQISLTYPEIDFLIFTLL